MHCDRNTPPNIYDFTQLSGKKEIGNDPREKRFEQDSHDSFLISIREPRSFKIVNECLYFLYLLKVVILYIRVT